MKQPTQRQCESAMWLNIARHIERTGRVPHDMGICFAANQALSRTPYDDWHSRSYGAVEACFGGGWPFGAYGDAEGNQLRVLAATLLSLVVCTDQEPEGPDA